MSKYTSGSPEQTKKIAADIIEEFWNSEHSGALVIALTGELGAGKTNFTQGVGEFLGIARTVTSPTFVLMKRYTISKNSPLPHLQNVIHIDAYRLESPKEVLELGWKEMIGDPTNLIVIEWAERIKNIVPSSAVWVEIKSYNESKREFTISPQS